MSNIFTKVKTMTDVPVFTYGTLLSPQVLQVVLGRVPDRVDAELKGYSRHPINGQCYPAVRPCDGKSVQGSLLRSLTASELLAMDGFEDPAYERCILPVWLSDDNVVMARVWARTADDVADLDLTKDWNYEYYLSAHEESYILRCARWAHEYYNS